jgi:hypothetical protein
VAAVVITFLKFKDFSDTEKSAAKAWVISLGDEEVFEESSKASKESILAFLSELGWMLPLGVWLLSPLWFVPLMKMQERIVLGLNQTFWH